MSTGKKPITQVDSHEAWSFLSGFSKAALADIVVDLVRRNAGSEDLDGAELVAAITADAEPVMIARGDKMPKAHPNTIGKWLDGRENGGAS